MAARREGTVLLRFAITASLVIAIASAATASAAVAQAAPPALTGEKLSAQLNAPNTTQPVFLGLCGAPPPVPGATDYTSTQTFTFNGTAAGPFPGTFTESGSVTTTFPPGFVPPGYSGTVQAFSASFRITSSAGTITGTKSMTVMGQAGQCSGASGGTSFSSEVVADFTATISTPAGSYQDQGSSTVDLGAAWQYANVSYATLAESFVSQPVNTSRPTISGTPIEGQVFAESPGSWTGAPSSYTYAWQRCDAAGNGCTPIPGATGKAYTPTAADVGSTIRVEVWAANAGGIGCPATSAATPVIEAPAGTSSPSPPPPPPPPPTLSGGVLATSGGSSIASLAQIKAQLLGQLVPTGRAARIGAVLGHGAYSFWFRAHRPGWVSISWYYVPLKPRSGKARARPVLIASGALRLSTGLSKLSIKLTTNGKRLFRTARSVTLTATGTYVPAGMSAVSVARTIVLRR